MNELINIKVIQKDFKGDKKRFVNARELHQWLGVGKFFANWIKDRIEKYDFIEDLDYFISIPKIGNGLKTDKTSGIIKSIAKFGNGQSGLNKGKILIKLFQKLRHFVIYSDIISKTIFPMSGKWLRLGQGLK